MSTIKKNTSKASKSPAPATKAVTAKPTKRVAAPAPSAPAAKSAPARITPAGPAPVAVKIATTPVVAAPVAITPVAAAPIVAKQVAPKPLVTTITARVDVGFGNTLYLRGEGGPGLSWNQGLVMECVGPDLWRIVIEDSARVYTFKFLVNDVTWSTGPDFTATGGTGITLSPEF